MVDLGVALTWIVISAASARGLSAFARAAANNEIQEELAAGMREDGPARDDPYDPYLLDTPSRLLGVCP
jgi:hypothetical protein